MKVSTPCFDTAGEYVWVIVRHFLGHASTQALHCMQRNRSISHIFSWRLTKIASVGHFFAQSVHMEHLGTSISMLPRVLENGSLFSNGYKRVAGFLTAQLLTTLKIFNDAIFYRSVQLIQGSIVRTITGTSASWHPFNITTRAGIFANVGVRTLNLWRYLVPLPFT